MSTRTVPRHRRVDPGRRRPPRHDAGPPRADLLLVGVVAALAATVFALVHEALIDDSLITMAYARNLAFGLEWGLVAGQPANSATSPLNVVLLAAATAVVRDPLLAVGVVLVASAVCAARWLAALARQLGLSAVTPYVGAALLLLNPLLLSTTGLESYLGASLVVGLLRYGAVARPVAFGVVSGLAVLTRPDLAVFVLVAGVLLPRLGRVRAAAVAAAVAGPWHVFSWFALGSALPDTLLIKTGQGTWGSFGFGNGWQLYLQAAPAAAGPAFLPVAAGAAALVGVLGAAAAGWRHPVLAVASAAGLGAAGHYLAYAVLAPPPYHWYYAPLISGATLCLTLVVGAALAHRGRARALVGGVAAAAVVGLAAPMVWLDVGHGLPWPRAPLSTNWATDAQYETIGEDLRGIVGPAAVLGPGEIGALAYYCGCAVVDQFSDRGRMVAAITEREARSGPVTRALIAANYAHLDRARRPVPVAYRLVYEAGARASGPGQWPVDHWAEGPGRMVLVEEPG